MSPFAEKAPSHPTSPPFDWVEAIAASTLEMDDIPLLGGPPFPWEKLSEGLAALLQTPITLSGKPFSWKEGAALQGSLGDAAQWVAIRIEGMPGELYWGMSKEALQAFSCHLLLKKEEESTLVDDDMTEGFFRFLLLSVLELLGQLQFPAECHLTIGKAPEGLQAALECQVEVQWKEDRHVTGHVVITDPLRRAWRDRHAATPSQSLRHRSAHAEVMVSVEAGKVRLTQKEWDSIHQGDYLLLDRCTLDPETQEGHVALYLEDLLLLQGHLSGSTIELIEQKDGTMHDDDDDFDDLDEDFEDEVHDEDESSEDEDLADDEDESSEDEDLADDEDESSEDEDDEFSFDEDYFEGETAADRFEHAEEQQEPAPKKVEAPTRHPTAPRQHVAQAPGTIEKLKLQEMPLKLSVEVAKLRMEVGKLMDLQPGNLLDLGIRPSDGVYLTHKGRRIAKGELVRAGERLALRIVEL